MWVYLGLLLVPVAIAFASRSRPTERRAIYLLTFLALAIAVGLRHQVGCDWNPYQYMFVRAQSAQSLPEALTHGTAGYLFLNWIVAQSGLGVAGVNTFCALILLAGLFSFCRVQPRPWIGFLVSTPILLMLAAFNTTRQSVAIGVFLYCLYLHQTGRWRGAIIPLMLVAGTFHVTAFAMLPLFVAMRINWRLSATAIVLLGGAAGIALAVAASLVPGLGDRFPTAGGAWFRVIPTAMAILCLPLIWNRVLLSAAEREMLKWLAAFAFFCLGLGFFSTVILDRMNYYAVPFQIAVFSRLATLAATGRQRIAINIAIGAPFVILLAAWLALSESKRCLEPYRTYLAEPKGLLGAGASTDYQLRYDADTWGREGPPPSWPPPIPAPGVRSNGSE